MPFKDPAAQTEYQRQWTASRRAEFMADKRCVDCGAVDDLQLDHRDPSQKADHKIWSWSEPRRLAEIAKCVIRCGPCHRERHAAERRKCGLGGYKRGCRCEICRDAKRVSNARYLAKKATHQEGIAA